MSISAKIGFGPKVSGEAVFLGAAQEVATHHLSLDLTGKILILPRWVGKEFVQKADFVGVLGVVVPAMHYRDFDYFRKQGGLTLLVVEQFGELDASPESAKKLASFDRRQVVVDGEEKTLVLLQSHHEP
ncbi:MAG: hypothetical protein UY21_C0009G0032 [Microgenomates group bacterium GW2011_GWA1_48_10]|nr:MAG: hypothetical protein UY21_C0009G0032 [Microgenomates group bacterium GW2011_GWA1_48_10]